MVMSMVLIFPFSSRSAVGFQFGSTDLLPKALATIVMSTMFTTPSPFRSVHLFVVLCMSGYASSKEAGFLKISSFDTVDRLFLEKVIVKVGASLHKHEPLNDELAKIVGSQEIKL
jgi:hypothetical protein